MRSGFLVSERGQFELIPINTNTTRLEGTTWYRHGLWPEWYWQLWSDHIIHTIHLRVLRHIKSEAESRQSATLRSRPEKIQCRENPRQEIHPHCLPRPDLLCRHVSTGPL
ncbi:MAG TPA: hypothetical protein VF773_21580 [Verrucomicrobiae bacterium]